MASQGVRIRQSIWQLELQEEPQSRTRISTWAQRTIIEGKAGPRITRHWARTSVGMLCRQALTPQFAFGISADTLDTRDEGYPQKNSTTSSHENNSNSNEEDYSNSNNTTHPHFASLRETPIHSSVKCRVQVESVRGVSGNISNDAHWTEHSWNRPYGTDTIVFEIRLTMYSSDLKDGLPGNEYEISESYLGSPLYPAELFWSWLPSKQRGGFGKPTCQQYFHNGI